MKIQLIAPAIALALTATVAVAQDNPPTSQDSSQARSAQAPEFRCAARDRSMPDPNSTRDPVITGRDSAAARAPVPLPLSQSWVDRRLCQALEGITLTDGQQRQIDSIRARYYASLGGILSDSGVTVEQRVALDAQDSAVRAQLSSEQQALWDRNIARLNANVVSTRRR